MTEYEIKSQETLAWYQGYVHDYDESKRQFFVTYEKNWKTSHYVDPGDIRPAADPTPPQWKPSVEEKCECKAKAEEHEPFGWWACQVKSIKNNNIMIRYSGFDHLDESVEKSFLRPFNDKKSLTSRNMKKESIVIPPDLLPWIQSNPSEIADLRSRLVHLKIDESNSRLILIGNEKSLKSVKGIIELYFHKQKDLKDFESKAKLDEAKLEEQKQKEGNAVKRTFKIHPLLTGFLLGPKKKKYSTN